MKSKCCSYLRQCHNNEEGGFGGAPYHRSHIASSYAAMLAIVNIGTKEAYDIIDIEKMKKFLISVKNNHTFEK
jgi:prenyltransferase beta subunit